MLDIEGWVRDRLADQFPLARVCTETPADLGSVLPCIRVVRVGGRDKDVVLDVASVDVDVFHESRDEARKLAELVRDYLTWALPQVRVADGGTCLTASTLSAPSWRPWDNTTLRRVGALYDLTIQATP